MDKNVSIPMLLFLIHIIKIWQHIVRSWQVYFLAGLLPQENVPQRLKKFVTPLLLDEDYVEQNLTTVADLLKKRVITTDAHVRDLEALKTRMGGFITPALSRKYLEADGQEAKEDVIASYQKMMDQVLGSGKIEIDDPNLLAEAIYLAYRPMGYSVESISDKLSGWRGLEDLTHHLDRLTFKKEGYAMRFNFVEREQTVPYDEKVLRSIDAPLFSVSLGKRRSQRDLVIQALSAKQDHKDALPLLFGQVLSRMGDARVAAYKKSYGFGADVSHIYTSERLESLSELLGIIPKEDAFKEHLAAVLDGDEAKAVIQTSADIYQWKQNKRHFSPEERQCKNRMDEILKHLGTDEGTDVGDLVRSPEMAVLGDEVMGHIGTLANGELRTYLTDLRASKFLGYGENSGVTSPFDVFYHALLGHAKGSNTTVKREAKKVKSVRSDEYADVRAVVSKNVGSYFAKAGAELCTANNMGMWNEERHVHLNVVHQNQIIGNVMMYFEEDRSYMVTRGFNPRNDALLKFDRRSMATEIVRVLEEIMVDNHYEENFIPPQGFFIALANREGMAKEVLDISRATCARVQRDHPGQRTQIDDARFYVTEQGGPHVYDTLHLLSFVPKAA